ncbi:MAG TPA: ParB/RepB/Spo0J family partition protein [Abditibacteriaceae bacterium]|jgi:ParB family chromosome partitioning protein
MATTKRGLGRGLSALIPDDDMEFLSRMARGDASLTISLADSIPHEASTAASQNTKKAPTDAPEIGLSLAPEEQAKLQNNPVWVSHSSIEANPYQPRRFFALEEMSDLVASVKEHGIIQPILVRPNPENREKPYQLIAGERRWRAAQEAGLEQVPVVIRAVNDQQALELALIENVQRHDISVIDAAHAYRRLSQEFSLSQEDIARRVGKSRPAISNTMRLLDLPEEAQKALEDGSISEGHGRAILLAPGEGARRAVFRLIVRDKLTVRDAEEAARRSIAVSDPAASAQTANGQNTSLNSASTKLSGTELKALRVTEEELSKVLGTRVRIRPRAKGGQVSIEYFSPEDLDTLLGKLKGSAQKQ